MWGAFLGGKVTGAWGRPNLHLLPKLRMGFTITPFRPYAFIACKARTRPFIFIIRTHFLVADHVTNNGDKFASLWKRQCSLSLPKRVTITWRLSATNYIMQRRITFTLQPKAKCWPQDELPNPVNFCRYRTAAACRYVSPCYTGNVSQLRVLLWKVWFQRSFITCTSNGRKVFHASGCQDLSKNAW